MATGKEIIHRYLAKKNRTVTEQQKELILKALKVRVKYHNYYIAFAVFRHLLPTAREGNVFTGVCLSTIGLMDTGSLLGLVMARSVRILLECFLV